MDALFTLDWMGGAIATLLLISATTVSALWRPVKGVEAIGGGGSTERHMVAYTGLLPDHDHPLSMMPHDVWNGRASGEDSVHGAKDMHSIEQALFCLEDTGFDRRRLRVSWLARRVGTETGRCGRYY